jgi:hypothetical protein
VSGHICARNLDARQRPAAVARFYFFEQGLPPAVNDEIFRRADFNPSKAMPAMCNFVEIKTRRFDSYDDRIFKLHFEPPKKWPL